MREHGVEPIETVETWSAVAELPPEAVAAITLPIERGFKADGARHERRDMKSCFGCHKRVAKADYLFTLKQLKAFAGK